LIFETLLVSFSHYILGQKFKQFIFINCIIVLRLIQLGKLSITLTSAALDLAILINGVPGHTQISGSLCDKKLITKIKGRPQRAGASNRVHPHLRPAAPML
jgi:hypothetical protein